MRAKSFNMLFCSLALAVIAYGQDATSPAAKPPADEKSKPIAAEQKTAAPMAKEDARAATAKGTTLNDPDYVIGADDVIGINVWHEPEMSRTMTVRPDGKISMPLIGEFVAEGKTPKQLQDELSKKLDTLLKNPDVTVYIQEIRSQKFNILGEVQRPGVYPLSKPMSILDAIAVSGGFRDFANPKKMYILRRGKDGNRTKVAVDYNSIIKGSEKDPELESRDTIVVP